MLHNPAIITSVSCCSDKAFLNADLNLLPDIVVNSAGTQAIAVFPIVASCVDTMSGCHSNGKVICEVEDVFIDRGDETIYY